MICGFRTAASVTDLVLHRIMANVASGSVGCAELATGDRIILTITYNTDDA